MGKLAQLYLIKKHFMFNYLLSVVLLDFRSTYNYIVPYKGRACDFIYHMVQNPIRIL
jgi:hypothetical protein